MSRKLQVYSNGTGLLAMLLAYVLSPADVNACIIFDFGDAPSYYGTLDADGGAKHGAEGNLFLGAIIDDEHDGQPSFGTDGDDLAGLDDEDGITFSSPLAAGELATLNAIATGAGLLNAWIDFNADGDWDDADEQIFADVALAGGVNPLSMAVPGGAILGDTYARFRFDSGGGLTPYGVAWDGEVEDYRVSIVPEPTTALLLAGGLAAMAVRSRRRPA
jgi:hypothetical protein